MIRFINGIFIPIALILITSCSSNPGGALIPDENSPVISDLPQSETAGQSNRQFLGSWQMEFDIENVSGTIRPIRESMLHFSVRPYLPNPTLSNISYDPVTEVLEVDVTIKNQNLYHFDGYDVRLIIYTDAAGHLLLNDDSWTGLWDIPGARNINPFKAFKIFPPRKLAYSAEDSQHLEVKCPGGNFFVQFAIDASWPGNCTEPYQIDNYQQEDDLYDTPGATAKLRVEVYDWQDDVDQVAIECPEITGQPYTQFIHSSGVTWILDITNNFPAPPGEYEATLWATSSGSGDLKLCEVVSILVTEKPCVLMVEEITGPTSIGETECENYTVTASGEPYITYLWTCEPSSLGYFSNPDDSNTEFCANEIDIETVVVLFITVEAENCDPVIKQKSVTILTNPCVPDIAPPNKPQINSGCTSYPPNTTQITLGVSGSDPDNCTSSNELRYEWQKSLNDEPYDNWHGPFNGPDLLISGLSEGSWDFQVRSVDNNDNRSLEVAECLDLYIPPCPLPAYPQNLNATERFPCEKIHVTWNSVAGASSYHVYINNGERHWYTTDLFFDDTSASPQTYYTYEVATINSCGEGPKSPGVWWGMRCGTPPEPTGFRASDSTDLNTIYLTWNHDNNSCAKHYKVYRNEQFLVELPDGVNHYEDNVGCGQSFSYRVSGVNPSPCGEGPKCYPDSGSTKPCP